MNRNATVTLTKRDKLAAKKAILDSRQGIVRNNGTL